MTADVGLVAREMLPVSQLQLLETQISSQRDSMLLNLSTQLQSLMLTAENVT